MLKEKNRNQPTILDRVIIKFTYRFEKFAVSLFSYLSLFCEHSRQFSLVIQLALEQQKEEEEEEENTKQMSYVDYTLYSRHLRHRR